MSKRFSRRTLVRSVGAAASAYGLPALPAPQEETRALGPHRQLFLDDYLVAELRDAKRVLNPVRKHPANPVLVPEFPWEFKEDFTWDGASVLYNPDRREFQLWYGIVSARVCYATSPDGLHWEKPKLNLVSYRGSRGNNIVFNGSQPSVIRRPDVPPDRRYLMQLNALWEAGREPQRGATFTSPDGLRWQPVSKESLHLADSSYTFYDPYSKRYVLVSKQSTRMGELPCPVCAQKFVPDRRTLSIAFSDDFMHWSDLEPILIPDRRDEEMARARAPVVAMLPPLEDGGDLIYGRGHEYRQAWRGELDRALRNRIFRRVDLPPAPGLYQRTDFMDMPVIPYEGVYIGILWYLTITAPAPHYGLGWSPGSEFHGGHDGIMEAQLTVSRDLRRWERCADRLPLIPVGDSDAAWDSCMIFPCNSPLVIGDEIWLFYGGSNFSHMNRLMWDRRRKFPERRQAIGLGKLRLDGFVSVDAAGAGVLTTRPLTFQGRELVLNASAPRGRVTAEILDAQFHSVPGYRREDCDPFSGDNLRHVIRWKGSSVVSPLSGRPVRLRFYLEGAKLYSFQFRS